MTKNATPELQQLPIWRCLQERGSPEQIYRVGKLVDIAKAKLSQIRDTFPTYTIHDREHADNVVDLMGELLGARVRDLSAVEAAMLVLSAYFHDTGMAFSAQERKSLQSTEHFARFLMEYPAAEVAVETAGSIEVPVGVAESFCRWRHAERVFQVLHEVAGYAPQLLQWGVVDISEQLGHVCRSHNLDAGLLIDDAIFSIDFLAECDTRFIAVLLRLADMLDFDRSRSPDQLYRDLGLALSSAPHRKTSDLEWRKHLASDGFVFPAERAPGYPIAFIAGPDEPAVEHDIRQFLDLIEGELGRCGSVIRSCSDRWRTHPLPGRIDRNNLRGNGYSYGEYRFTLDQHQILNLLMGERLYQDPYTFIRELLQNALDASRHREFHERAAGNVSFVCEPVRISSWLDSDGYHWVEVADYGMGMTEEIIRNFLLKVGRSYYSSSRFEADVIRYSRRTHDHFCPVSRFGIGLLSCFIVGDRVEVFTRHAVEGGGPIRLSLPGLQSFFVLQKPPNPLRPMPGPRPPRTTERPAGTTVTVRLDATREQGALDLRDQLERQVLCSPIQVLLEREPVGFSRDEILARPWCDAAKLTLSRDMTTRLGEVLGHQFSSPPAVRLIPLDITASSPISEIEGQFVVAFIEDSEEWIQAIHVHELSPEDEERRQGERKDVDLAFLDNGNKLKLSASYFGEVDLWDEPQERGVELELGLETFWSLGADVRRRFLEPGTTSYHLRMAGLEYVGHNGIRLPPPPIPRYEAHKPLLTESKVARVSTSRGVLTLRDRLRPDLSIAREETVSIDWPIRSAALLAYRRALRPHLSDRAMLGVQSVFIQLSEQRPSLADVGRDALITDETMWPAERIFTSHDNRVLSVVDLLNDPTLEARIAARSSSDLSFVRIALARTWLAARLEMEEADFVNLVVSAGPTRLVTEGEKLFPPLTYVPYSEKLGSVLIWKSSMALRLDHPFSVWFLANATTLRRDLSGLFGRLRDCLFDLSTWQGSFAILEINAILRRIKELRPELAPPRKAFLKKSDIGHR